MERKATAQIHIKNNNMYCHFRRHSYQTKLIKRTEFLTSSLTRCNIFVRPEMTSEKRCRLIWIKHFLFCSSFTREWVFCGPVRHGNWKENTVTGITLCYMTENRQQRCNYKYVYCTKEVIYMRYGQISFCPSVPLYFSHMVKKMVKTTPRKLLILLFHSWVQV